jgi:hypothetical protein
MAAENHMAQQLAQNGEEGRQHGSPFFKLILEQIRRLPVGAVAPEKSGSTTAAVQISRHDVRIPFPWAT